MTRPTPSPLLLGFAGVLLAYVALAVIGGLAPFVISALFSPDQLFEPGCFAPTPLFAGLQLGLAGAGALIAGFLCRRVAGGRRPVWVFAAIIGVISLYTALFSLSVPHHDLPTPRIGGESAEDVQTRMAAEQPSWLVALNPLILIGGILLGGSRKA